MILAAPVSVAAPVQAAHAPVAIASPRAVIVRYYAAIARREYRIAWLSWDRDGAASGRGEAAFARGFARTVRVQVHTAAIVDAEGAAGSLFVTVPVDVRAVLNDGTRQHFVGSYVLRRVNDVPGSTVGQRQWHLFSATLRPVR